MAAGALKRIEAGEPEMVRMRIGGEWRDGSRCDEIQDPYRGEVVALAPCSTAADLDAALRAAVGAKAAAAAMPGYERATLLRRAAGLLGERAEEIAHAMSRETGKALKDSRAEALRTLDTLQLPADEAVRIEGDHVPLDATGGVILNGTSTWRTDQLPYGGVDDSGIGREGPRYTIRDMTEERLAVFKP